ncbi:MAG: peroxidase-related enzyme [Bacteroidetes bacterium]|jgi:uncharacterized peroxidase-related enzyme|nr:peroxidase-related enzyme [Bacteroidota bacterium]
MPYIDIIDEADATGALKDAYDAIAQTRGKVANIMKIHSLHPAAMLRHMELYQTLLFGRSGLKRAERELIATVVSSINGCAYCTHHHAEALRAYWKDEARVQSIVDVQLDAAALTKREQAMAAYARLLTEAPTAVTDAHVDPLRDAGLSDRDILDVNLITSYFNFVNRIAEGLGVPFSPEEMTGYTY